MMSSKRLLLMYGVQAGIFACLASVFGKLALHDRDIQSLCMKIGERLDYDLVAPCSRIAPFLRVACFGMVFVSNSLMWLYFTKTLNVSSTTAEAVAVNSAANFLFTGIAGVILFSEVVTWKWALGTCCIIFGLVCINLSNSESDRQESRDATGPNKEKVSWDTETHCVYQTGYYLGRSRQPYHD